MGLQLNKEAYKVLLIDKDIELLEKYFPASSLEKQHIIDVLNWSVEQLYPSMLEKSSDENSGLHKHVVTAMLPFLEEMSKHENEQLGKLLTPYSREKHANNKYCIAIVKELIESRFGN